MAVPAALLLGGRFKLHPLDAHGGLYRVQDFAVHRMMSLSCFRFDRVSPAVGESEHVAVGHRAQLCHAFVPTDLI
ncbi:hypothetical protein Ga0080574_TMP2802 [Salipiger abyssi]|uniref:Uncharacterized protein n=1 Tax=Salipiger abyssi TaxID=1250539 RepID=A0A1P8UUV3_9RHOB|nr:hypothetical protein Ga0080574_TMP2802 [Salipiger abyssi]